MNERAPLAGAQIAIDFGPLHTTLRLLGNKMGPIYTLWLGRSFPLVVVTGEEATQEALVTQGAVFATRPALLSWQYTSSGYRTTMTSPMGSHWQKLRKIIRHDLLSPAKLASCKPARDSEIQRLLDRFTEQAATQQHPATAVQPLLALRSSAVNIIMRIGFGDGFARKDPEESDCNQSNNQSNAQVVELDRSFREVMDAGTVFQIALVSSAFLRTLLYPISRKCHNNIRRVLAQITATVMPIVLERKKQLLQERPGVTAEAKTFMDALINLKGEDASTDAEIVWNIAELVVGATDNTSHILEWVLANMVTYPEMQQKVFEEIQRAMEMPGPNSERALEQERDLVKLPFMQAVVKESMRRHMMQITVRRAGHSQDRHAGYQVARVRHPAGHDGDLPRRRVGSGRDALAGSAGVSSAEVSDHERRRQLCMRAAAGAESESAAELIGSCSCRSASAGGRARPGSSMGMLHLLLANLLYVFRWGPEKPGQPVDFSEKFRMVVTMKTRLRASISE